MDSVTADLREAEARALKELFEARAGVSQAEFGRRHKIGSAGMVWQYLNGHRPLNLTVATKFAQGLGVRIQDFSPRLGATVAAASRLVEERGASYEINPSNDLPLADVLKHGSAEDRQRVIDTLRSMAVRARAQFSPEQFARTLDALDQLEHTAGNDRH